MPPASSVLLVLISFTLASQAFTLVNARSTLQHGRSTSQHQRSASGTTFSNVRLAWYNPGPTSCNTVAHDDDFIVALSTQQWDGGAHCNAPVHIQYQGTTVAARVMDECPGCEVGQLDLTPGLFTHLNGNIAEGAIVGSWSFDDLSVPTSNTTIGSTSSATGQREVTTLSSTITAPVRPATELLGGATPTSTTPSSTRAAPLPSPTSPIPVAQFTSSPTPPPAATEGSPTSPLPLGTTTPPPTNLNGTAISLQLSTTDGTIVTVTKLVLGPSATADSSAPGAQPAQTTTSALPAAAQRSGSTGPPAIVGIVVGCVLFVFVGVLLGFEWMRRRRRRKVQERRVVDLRPLGGEMVLDIGPPSVRKHQEAMRFSTVPSPVTANASSVAEPEPSTPLPTDTRLLSSSRAAKLSDALRSRPARPRETRLQPPPCFIAPRERRRSVDGGVRIAAHCAGRRRAGDTLSVSTAGESTLPPEYAECHPDTLDIGHGHEHGHGSPEGLGPCQRANTSALAGEEREEVCGPASCDG
ncbi:hypothetical protein C8Q78DRAFT_446289 [Trametes maxima]|nr:hypothetical protein C8Q78DRAFT_446289 [Trametes maxima]